MSKHLLCDRLRFSYVLACLLRTSPVFVHGPQLPICIASSSQVAYNSAQDHLHLHKLNARLTIMGVFTRPLRHRCFGNSTHLQDATKREIVFLRCGWPKGRKNRILLRRKSFSPHYAQKASLGR